MAVKADSKLLAELRRQILFDNENLLRPFDIRTKFFCGERGNQAELDMIYLPAFRFQTFVEVMPTRSRSQSVSSWAAVNG